MNNLLAYVLTAAPTPTAGATQWGTSVLGNQRLASIAVIVTACITVYAGWRIQTRKDASLSAAASDAGVQGIGILVIALGLGAAGAIAWAGGLFSFIIG